MASEFYLNDTVPELLQSTLAESQMPFLLPNYQLKNTEWKQIHK